jgi:hypothetical protein
LICRSKNIKFILPQSLLWDASLQKVSKNPKIYSTCRSLPKLAKTNFRADCPLGINSNIQLVCTNSAKNHCGSFFPKTLFCHLLSYNFICILLIYHQLSYSHTWYVKMTKCDLSGTSSRTCKNPILQLHAL